MKLHPKDTSRSVDGALPLVGKTRYCVHSAACDRVENCAKDEYCPLYRHDPSAKRIAPDEARGPTQADMVAEFDRIWKGEGE